MLVTKSNKDNITGSGIKGTITYVPEINTLTLTDATITSATNGIKSGRTVPGLKIVLNGTNTISMTASGRAAIDLQNSDGASIEGDGTLNIEGSGSGLYLCSGNNASEPCVIKNCEINMVGARSYILSDNGDEQLTINNATVRLADGMVSSGNNLQLINCEITKPAGAFVEYGNITTSDSYGYYTGEIEILPKAAQRGDVNGDGRMNVSDVTMLINMILGITPVDAARADLNGDTKVNVSDVTSLINIILGVSSK